MRPYILSALALIAMSPGLVAQDIDKDICLLVEQRAKAIDEINKEFEANLAKLRDAKLRSLEEELAMAMKSLDLEKSNKINELRQVWKQFSPQATQRRVFIRRPKDRSAAQWFFVRGPDVGDVFCKPSISPKLLPTLHNSCLDFAST